MELGPPDTSVSQKPPEEAHTGESRVDKEDADSEHSEAWEMVSALPDSPSASASPGSVSGMQEPADRLEDTFMMCSTEDAQHSDAETHLTDDFFRRGEPDLTALSTGPAPGGAPCVEVSLKPIIAEELAVKCEPQPEPPIAGDRRAILVQRGAAVGAAVGRLAVSLVDRLRALAARVRAYVAHHQPTVHRFFGWMAHKMQAIVSSLQLRIAPGCMKARVLVGGGGATVAARDLTVALMRGVHATATSARKGNLLDLAKKHVEVDWARVILTLGCVGLMGALWRAQGTNAKLMARVTQREAELAELVARIVALQRNITSQRVPIIRHAAMASGWPVVIHTI